MKREMIFPRPIAWSAAGFLALSLLAYVLFQLLNPDARMPFFAIATCVIPFITARIYGLAQRCEQERLHGPCK